MLIQGQQHIFSDPIHKRFSAHEEFLDRRDKVVSARTYFYDDEAKCDDNMNIFLQCVDAVSGLDKGRDMTYLGP